LLSVALRQQPFLPLSVKELTAHLLFFNLDWLANPRFDCNASVISSIPENIFWPEIQQRATVLDKSSFCYSIYPVPHLPDLGASNKPHQDDWSPFSNPIS
jgi:hypothetical protein